MLLSTKFYSIIKRIEGFEIELENKDQRYDKESLHDFSGTFGEYFDNKLNQPNRGTK